VLAVALKEIPMSIAYVVWTGAGTAGVVLFGAVLFADVPTLASWVGVALVVAGVVMINAKKRAGEEGAIGEAEEHPE
jgi:small multidrug resistance pump